MPVAIGDVVVRELFLAGGGRSSTATLGYGSCSRPGEAPAGSAGRTEKDYVVGGYAVFPHKARSSDRSWYRSFYGASM